MSWYQALGVCSTVKLYRATHRVPAGPLLSQVGLANQPPFWGHIYFSFTYNRALHQVTLRSSRPGSQLSSKCLPISALMHCRLTLYTHSQRTTLLKFLRNSCPLVSSTHVWLKSDPDHPMWSRPIGEPFMNVLLISETESTLFMYITMRLTCSPVY